MSEASAEKRTHTAWVYGCLRPLDWDEECEREAATDQAELWNTLVAIETNRRVQEDALYRRHPLLEPIMDRLDAVEARLAEIPRRAATPDERDERRALWAERRELWERAKPFREQVRKFEADAFTALRDARYEAMKLARQESGLWWGNYNAVCARFDVTLAKLGPGEMVRPKLPTPGGNATLTNQIQGGGIAGPVFLAKGHAQVKQDGMPPGHVLLKRGAGRKGLLRRLSVTVWSAGRGVRKMVTLPIVWHRDLPDGAVIKNVIVQRRRIAADDRQSGYRWQAIFVCDIPAPLPHTSNLTAGIDLGWRLAEGGLRVATLVGNDDSVERLLLPQAWIDKAKRYEAMRGTWRKAKDAGEDVRELARVIAHGTDKLRAERRDLYRVFAGYIAEHYGCLAIDAEIKPLATRKVAGHSELPPAVRHMRTFAAGHVLASEFARAAKVRGGTILYAKGRSTQTCHVCGHVNQGLSAARRADLVWQCEGCGEFWDQDENAARVLMAAASGSSAATTVELAEKRNQGLKRARMTRRGSARKPPDKPLTKQPERTGP